MMKINKSQIKELTALFVFSVCLLAVQTSFTKFFSIVMWYHFGYMIISVAMLGFSVSGVFLSMSGKLSKSFSFSKLISVSSFVTFISYLMMTHITFTPRDLIFKGVGLFSLFAVLILLFIPFFLFGLTIGWILRERKERIGRYYSVNMIGSAMGALLFIWIFNTFNGYIAIPLIVFLMAVSAILVADNIKEKALSAVLCLVIFPTLFFPSLFPMEPPGDKILGLVKDRKNDVIHTDWSALSKIDMVKDPDRTVYPFMGLWGMSRTYFEQGKINPDRIGIVIDSWAYTSIMRYPQNNTYYDYMPATTVYHLGKKIKKTLHIGAGGGMDLLAAHHYGVDDITGVEINPIIVKSVKNEFRDYSGGIYSGFIKGVKIVVDEGRNFIESGDDTYDVIQLSGVDTFSSTQAGAFALSENNLYTVEAFRSYYEKLNNNGYFTMTSWFAPDEAGNPRFSLRLLNIARKALREMNIDPKGRIMFFASDTYTLMVLKKGTFTRDEIKNGLDYVFKNRFAMLVTPGREPNENNIFERFLFADDSKHKKLIEDYPYLVSAPTDDKPFFFELRKLETLFTGINSNVLPLNVFSGQTILFIILFMVLLMGMMFILSPLYVLKKKNRKELAFHDMLYFSLIGLGYMFVEIVLTQKLVLYLGHPSYSLSIALFSILLFSGLGSFFSDYKFLKKRTTLVVLSAILLLVILTLSPILSATLGAPFSVRVLITLLILAPLSFFMGTAFPAGASRVSEKELPFLWGINGFFSVVASVTAIIISINMGFTFVFYISFLCYAGAAAIMYRRG